MTCSANVITQEWAEGEAGSPVRFSPGRSLTYLAVLIALGSSGVLLFQSVAVLDVTIVGQVYGILYLAVAVTVVVRKMLTPRPRNWLAPEVLFLGTYWVFHFGYLTPYSFGWIDPVKLFIPYPRLFPSSVLLIYVSLLAFLIGYELAARQRVCHDLDRTTVGALWVPVGKAIAVVGVIAQLIGLAMAGFDLLFSLGYGLLSNMYRYADPRLFGIGQYMLPIGLTIACCASAARDRTLVKGWFFRIGIGGFAVLTLLFGDRGIFLTYALPVILSYQYFAKRIRLRWLVSAAVTAILIFGVLGLGRRTASANPADLVDEAFAEGAVGVVLFSALSEMGGSMRTVALTMNLVPDPYPYWYGESLWDSVVSVLPNLGASARLRYLGPDSFITHETYGYGKHVAGVGFSIAAEGYINFGWAGPALLLLIGIGARYIHDSVVIRPTLMRMVLLITMSSCLVMWIRNWSMIMVRPMVWTLLLVWLLQGLLGSRRRAS